MKNKQTIFSKACIIFLFLAFFSCQSKYSDGLDLIEKENYPKAIKLLKSIVSSSQDFDSAQLKIHFLDSIIDRQYFEEGKRLLARGEISNAKMQFFKIDSSSYYYSATQQYRRWADSMRIAFNKDIDEANQQYEEEQRKQKVEASKRYYEEERRMQNSPEVKALKKRIRTLYFQLQRFKSKSDFQKYGFGAGYKYNDWLVKVKALRDSPLDDSNGTAYSMSSLLLQCGLEYIDSNGRETEYTLWAKPLILAGTKP
jgi:hypothetical protein